MSNTHPAIDGSTGKRRKLYVDCPKSESKTCMIHSNGNYSDEYKVLGEFVTKYAAAQPTKDHGGNTTPRKRFHKKQEKHAIIKNVVDETQMTESKKVSAVNHE